MQFSIHSLLISFLPPLIYMVGFAVCLIGYRLIKRKVYLYATFFFFVNSLQHWHQPLGHYYTYQYSETYLSISSLVNLGFMFLSIVTLSLLVWGFYLEVNVNSK
jgi:hypothetical protein